MASEERPAKRLRSSMDASNVSQSPSAFCRGETWMHDGNVVLQSAPDKDLVATRFRVHWSMICCHSTVFADMHSVPQPPEQDMVDGCPLVVLSDTAEDLNILLGALYNSFFTQGKLPIRSIDAMLRLGKKYDFARFRSEAIRRLRHDWPAELDGGWDKPKEFQTVDQCDIFEVIAVAYEHRINVVLPGLLYEVLTLYDLHCLVDKYESGNIKFRLPAPAAHACIRGYGNVMKMQKSLMYSWLMGNKGVPCNECPAQDVCRNALQAFAADYLGMYGKLHGLETWPKALWDKHPLCSDCEPVAKGLLQKGRETFWDMLPRMFGFGSWEELKNSPELVS